MKEKFKLSRNVRNLLVSVISFPLFLQNYQKSFKPSIETGQFSFNKVFRIIDVNKYVSS